MKLLKHYGPNGPHRKFRPIAGLICRLRRQPNTCAVGSIQLTPAGWPEQGGVHCDRGDPGGLRGLQAAGQGLPGHRVLIQGSLTLCAGLLPQGLSRWGGADEGSRIPKVAT